MSALAPNRAPISRYRPPPRRGPPLPPRWTATQRPFDRPPLLQFVLLSMLLHALGILLFGAPAGGSREGRAMWGALQIELVGPFRDASSRLIPERRIFTPIVPRRVEPKPAPAPERRIEPPKVVAPDIAPPIVVPDVSPPPAVIPEASPPPVVIPEASPPPAVIPEASREAIVRDPIPIPPLLDRLSLPPERKLEKPPEFKAPLPTPPPPEPRIEIPAPLPIAPAPPARVERVPADAPPIAAPLAQPVPPVERAPVEAGPIPVEKAPAVETPAAPALPPPPIERVAPRVQEREQPKAIEQRAPEPPAAREPPAPREPQQAPTVREAPQAAPTIPSTPGTPSFAPRRGEAKDPSSTYDPTAAPPSLDADALRRRASQLAREGTGNRALLPFPMPPVPKPKSKLETAIENARKPDCRTAYQNLGLAAVVPLIANEFGEGNCRW